MMAFETLTEQIQALYVLGTSKQKDLVSNDMLNRLRAAQNSDNRMMMADILTDCFKEVADRAAGFEIRRLDRDKFSGKLNWLHDNAATMDDRQRLEFLAEYKRNIAQPALNAATDLAAENGLIKACIWTPIGETCDWCMSMAGTYEAKYASDVGFWASHRGCDCDKTIRWLDPEKVEWQ